MSLILIGTKADKRVTMILDLELVSDPDRRLRDTELFVVGLVANELASTEGSLKDGFPTIGS